MERRAGSWQHWKSLSARSGLFLVMVLIALGIVFRTADLSEKVYWVDEVATSIRVAGYTKSQVIEHLADGHVRTVEELQQFQQLHPDRGWDDTLSALVRSPEHAPLYFLLVRLWSEIVGSSVAAMRSFSVLLSLMALPGIAALSRELFRVDLDTNTAGRQPTGLLTIEWLSVSLLSVSPLFVAYAQEARPYSLWIVVLLGMHWTLLRAIRSNDRCHWIGYGISVILGLYTSLLSGLVLLGQGVYVATMQRWRLTGVMRHYALTLAVAIGMFMPWLIVVAQQWSALENNTTWARTSLSFLPMLAIWLYNVSVLYFDVPVVLSPRWIGLLEVLIALAIVSLIGFSIYFLIHRSTKGRWLFVLSLIATTPVCLISVDLLCGSQVSTAARYLLPSHLGMQLAMAYLLANKLTTAQHDRQSVYRQSVYQQSVWRWITALVITISCVSCLFQLHQPPKYQKSRNLHNKPIAAILNQANAPILMAEPQQTLDIISLSYSVKPTVQFQILPETRLLPNLAQCNLFVFNPSQALQNAIQAMPQIQLEAQYQPKRLVPTEISLSLWSIKSLENSCSH